MNVSIKERQDSDSMTTLEVTGEIDAFTAPQLKEKLMPLCRDSRVVYLDLSQVDYIDSTGLGVLIGAYKSLRAAAGRLVITGVSPRLERLFRITGLNEIIEIEGTQEDE
jgi:anti-sigma B factor antagonist